VNHFCFESPASGPQQRACAHVYVFVCDGRVLSPPLLKVVVTVTASFSKWNLHNFLSNSKFNSYFLANNSVLWPKTCRKCRSVRPGPRWESARRSPRPPSRLGRRLLGAFGASMLAPSAPRSSCPSDTKSWRRHWYLLAYPIMTSLRCLLRQFRYVPYVPCVHCVRCVGWKTRGRFYSGQP